MNIPAKQQQDLIRKAQQVQALNRQLQSNAERAARIVRKATDSANQ
jgi:hypothetical protein